MVALRLAQLARIIEDRFPDLVATVYPARHSLGGYANTDRPKPKGLRYRVHVGKGRRGTRLLVHQRAGAVQPIFEHNAAETYRRNQDVIDWINQEGRRRQGKTWRPV
jgi:hypothetical protein